MKLLDRMRSWQADQLEKGEARLERLTEKAKEADEAVQAGKRISSHNAKFGGHKISGGMYYYPGGSAHVGGATAAFESGAESKRMTVTRVGAGGLLFGPAGAVVGGMLKKDRTKCYVTITLATGETAIIESPAKEEGEARKFASAVNAAGAQLAEYN